MSSIKGGIADGTTSNADKSTVQKGLIMEDERREFTRFVCKKDELQVFSGDPIVVGKLNDMSKGGLSFQYTPIAGEKLDTNSISILAKDEDQFNLYHIGCRTIYDIPSLGEGQSFMGTKRRQCGMKFIGLKENQKRKLELLLKNYI